MLQHLSVKNYALIDKLELGLANGFSVITGETGAGKSIILGALGLVLGKRADLKSLRDPEKKCIIEASFELNKEKYLGFFEANDLDFETPCLVRREISPAGKSRAFINDTPVNLPLLNELSEKIIDVHSQHQTLLLNDNAFQLQLLDSYAKNEKALAGYKGKYQDWKAKTDDLRKLSQSIDSESKDTDYIEFLLKELQEAKLEPGEQENIEEELNILENSEEISLNLGQALHAIEDETGRGIHPNLADMLQALRQLAGYQDDFSSLVERVDSIRIEMDDIRQELENRSGNIDNDPERREKLDSRLSQLIHLQKKHGASSVEELIEKRQKLEEELDLLANFTERKAALEKELDRAQAEMEQAARALSESRETAIPLIENKISSLLTDLKMPDARFRIDLQPAREFTTTGADKIAFAFSANAGQKPQPLSKVASGGEMSRVMLALKAIMAEKNELPTIIFDEIDTGVSGETAGKVGQILRQMGGVMQVMAITHLPQIASMGQPHYKVLKTSSNGNTATQILKLNEDERLNELARLLSGEKITDAALANARNLLAHA